MGSGWTVRTAAARAAPACPSATWSASSAPTRYCPTVPRRAAGCTVFTGQVWFLPDLDRLAAAQTLHLKETGNFIVRRSSCQGGRGSALSLKLGYEHGFVVDHFALQERSGRVSLKCGLGQEFDTILGLVYHCSQHCDSLPVTLALPSILRQTESRQGLASFALLGKGNVLKICRESHIYILPHHSAISINLPP